MASVVDAAAVIFEHVAPAARSMKSRDEGFISRHDRTRSDGIDNAVAAESFWPEDYDDCPTDR